MLPMLKYGVRFERTYSFWLGLGIVTNTEKGIVISVGFGELTIGRVLK